MAAVMLAGAPLCNEAFAASELVNYTQAQTKKNLANGLKFVISFGSAASTQYLQVSKVADTNFVTRGVNNHQTDITKASVFEIRNYNGGSFELWVDGKQFVVKKDGNAYAKSDDKDIAKTFVAKNETATKTKVAKTTEFNKIYTYVVGETGIKLWGAELAPGSIKETLDADALKEINSSSTSFSFGADAVEGNIFQELTPCKYSDGSLSGTIFVKGTAQDIKAWEDAAVAKKKEAAAKLSIAYVKNETWGLNTSAEANGEGYKLVMINGAEFYAEKDAAKWNNAVFTGIAESDQLNAKDEIELTISPIVGKKTTGTPVNIAAVKTSASDTKTYVTTVVTSGSKYAKVIKPTLGDNTYFAASEFLSTGKSVYNVYFTSGKESVENGITTEFHKYLAVTANDAATAFEAIALATDDIQLDSPLAQWVATGFDGKYTLTLTNRQTQSKLVLKLKTTDDAGIYEIVGNPTTGNITEIAGLDYKDDDPTDDGKLNGKKIKLVKTTASKYDGFLNLSNDEMANGVVLTFTGKTATLGETTFYATPNKANNPSYLVATQDADKAAVLNMSRVEKEIESVLTYATLNDKNEVIYEKSDTLAMPAYNFTYAYETAAGAAKTAKATLTDFRLEDESSTSPAQNFYFQKAMDGHYVVGNPSVTNSLPAANDYVIGVNARNGRFNDNANWFNNAETEFAHVDVITLDKDERTSLAAVSRHATFVNNRGAVSLEVNKNGILEGILSAEPATFWLDTLTNGDEVSFYISKGIKAAEETKAEEAAEVRNFMYYANDSLNIFNEGSALATQNKNYQLEGTSDVKAIFRPATLAAHDSLVTVVDGKEKSLVKDALKAFQYGIVLADEEVADEYVIYSKAAPSKYLYSHNGKLGFGTKAEALVVKLGEGDATANEAIAAENVAVIAGEGVVTVKGAAGKQVVVSNILGQVIANKVATSDEETIAVAAGVAVVVVDGEATKVVVK